MVYFATPSFARLVVDPDPDADAERPNGDESTVERRNGFDEVAEEVGAIVVDEMGGADGDWMEVGRPPGVTDREPGWPAFPLVVTEGRELLCTMLRGRELSAAEWGLSIAAAEVGVKGASVRLDDSEGRRVPANAFMPSGDSRAAAWVISCCDRL